MTDLTITFDAADEDQQQRAEGFLPSAAKYDVQRSGFGLSSVRFSVRCAPELAADVFAACQEAGIETARVEVPPL